LKRSGCVNNAAIITLLFHQKRKFLSANMNTKTIIFTLLLFVLSCYARRRLRHYNVLAFQDQTSTVMNGFAQNCVPYLSTAPQSGYAEAVFRSLSYSLHDALELVKRNVNLYVPSKAQAVNDDQRAYWDLRGFLFRCQDLRARMMTGTWGIRGPVSYDLTGIYTPVDQNLDYVRGPSSVSAGSRDE
jgi:hypothetical protein